MVVICVLHKHATGTVRSEVERDISAGAGDERGESDVGGLGEGYGVPDASCEKRRHSRSLTSGVKYNYVTNKLKVPNTSYHDYRINIIAYNELYSCLI